MKEKMFAVLDEAINNGTEIEITRVTFGVGDLLGVVPTDRDEDGDKLIISFDSPTGKMCFIQVPIKSVEYDQETEEWLCFGDYSETSLLLS